MTIKVEIKNEKIYTVTPFSNGYKNKARQIGGKWDSAERAWVFDEKYKDLVNSILIEFYGVGIDGESETITVEYDASEFEEENHVMIGNLITATRYARDVPVDIKPGTVVVKGEFEGYGGSVKHPHVNAIDVILQSEIPMAIYDSLSDDRKALLKIPGSSEKEQLQAEKERLLKRIAEIDELLK